MYSNTDFQLDILTRSVTVTEEILKSAKASNHIVDLLTDEMSYQLRDFGHIPNIDVKVTAEHSEGTDTPELVVTMTYLKRNYA